jgi:uncharacterized protein YjbI with pentapeptide repeats
VNNPPKSKPSVAIKPPGLPKNLAPVTDLEELDDAQLGEFELSECNFNGQEAARVDLLDGQLTRVLVIGTSMPKARFQNLIVSKCDFSNAELVSSKHTRLAYSDCKMVGLKIPESAFTDVSFDNCIANLLHLYGSKLSNVIFKGCNLKNADFRSVQMENVRFENCEMQQAEFYGAQLQNVDLSGSRLDGVKANAGDLKGAIIDSQQLIEMAEGFAGMLGITVRHS